MATVAMLLVSCDPLEKVDPTLEVDKESISLSAVTTSEFIAVMTECIMCRRGRK